MSDPLADFLAREKEELAVLGDSIEQKLPESPVMDVVNDPLPAPESPVLEPAIVLDPIPSFDELTLAIPAMESEHLLEWKRKHDILIREKDDTEAQKKEEMQRTAKEQLEQWYKEREALIQKTKDGNRIAEAARNEEIQREQGATADWAEIAKMCETKATAKGRDVGRLRGILLGLKERSSTA